MCYAWTVASRAVTVLGSLLGPHCISQKPDEAEARFAPKPLKNRSISKITINLEIA